jgi:hypothetical protein
MYAQTPALDLRVLMMEPLMDRFHPKWYFLKKRDEEQQFPPVRRAFLQAPRSK